eukprot:TRINITY_DN3867_c0_g1_i1.p1 TRINITY_DN3867_c0_g1~~TRINITY_DN3867_c0_g1_i1.p1  ORF type:complete len:205 (+),score=44.88 TRINITY_DN3867_c0_g1_i1:8-622(+)
MAELWNFLKTWHCHGACRHESCFLAALRGFRQGAVYGVRIRLPHAVVMTFLFRTGTLQQKLKWIFDATLTHSRNLAYYVTIYKILSCAVRHITQSDTKFAPIIAGAIGGVLVFGKDNPVNTQINLYVFSRIFLGFVHTLVKYDTVPKISVAYPLFAGFTWACVMYLFEFEKENLQGSLQASMTELYHHADKYPKNPANPLEFFM